MKSITDGPFSFLHFEFDEVVDSVLDAPITEVVTISPKQGRTLEEVTTVMKKMHHLTPQFPGAMYGISIGQFIDQDPLYFLCFAGWDSVEVFSFLILFSYFSAYLSFHRPTLNPQRWLLSKN